MIIGNFTYIPAKDTYAGEIYRVVVEGASGAIELGAAWKRVSEAGREFLSVSLDDPALGRPLNAALMPSEKGDDAILIWSRPAKRAVYANRDASEEGGAQ